jgi:predicted house-cleaning NTP pyrophosphatase (Maf/HAM1 superfamily)
VLENSRQKALAVARSLNINKSFFIVIGADTVVTLGNKIYEKPSDFNEAKKMLSEYVLIN